MSRTLRTLVAVAAAWAGLASAQPCAAADAPASHAALAPQIAEFVDQISVRENGDGLARWKVKVCPQVAGLTRQEGEFILERITAIGRAAGVPLAQEQCRPNLYVFVTAQPKELLRAMDKRNVLALGDAPQMAIDEFITVDRPVRAWYNSTITDGVPIVGGEAANTSESLDVTVGMAPTYNSWDMPTHLLNTTVHTFSFVYVVVDLTRVRGIALGQLADYVAMVGLAEIKPAPRLGDANSILRLFAGGATGAPAGLSEWDQSFLKALYATEPKAKEQRRLIAASMVHDIGR